MRQNSFRHSVVTLLFVVVGISALHAQNPAAQAAGYSIEQLTFGTRHHFFGYIGHASTVPWNASGRYIVALRSTFNDHMPEVHEPADVVLLDTHNEYAVKRVDQTRGWNPQQGTMLYWNPAVPETQFFFNDRDPQDGTVFTVLFDISRGENGERVREFRFPDSPVANSGVAQTGGAFLSTLRATELAAEPTT